MVLPTPWAQPKPANFFIQSVCTVRCVLWLNVCTFRCLHFRVHPLIDLLQFDLLLLPVLSPLSPLGVSYLSIYLSIYPSIYLSIYLSIFLSFFLSLCISIGVHLGIVRLSYLTICLYACRCVCLYGSWCIYGWVEGRMEGCKDGWLMDWRMGGWMFGWLVLSCDGMSGHVFVNSLMSTCILYDY